MLYTAPLNSAGSGSHPTGRIQGSMQAIKIRLTPKMLWEIRMFQAGPCEPGVFAWPKFTIPAGDHLSVDIFQTVQFRDFFLIGGADLCRAEGTL